LLLGASPIANTQFAWTLLLSATPDALSPDGVSASQLTATLMDEWGMPMDEVTVAFSATNGTLSAAEGVTDANGQATVTLTARTDPTAITATASACGAWDEVALYDPAQAAGGDPAPPPPVQVEIVFPGGGTVAGMSLPVWGRVTVSDSAYQPDGAVWLYANDQCVDLAQLSLQPVPGNPTVQLGRWVCGMGVPLHGAAKQQTLVAKVDWTRCYGVRVPDPANPGEFIDEPRVESGTAASNAVAITVDNTPTVAGPTAYVTVPADPNDPEMGSVDGPAPSPLKGSLGLKAKATPASMWIPFDAEFLMGGYLNVDSVDSVRFEAGGLILADVAPGPEPELDPADPTGLTVIYRAWWDTAEQWEAGDVGADGNPIPPGQWGDPK